MKKAITLIMLTSIIFSIFPLTIFGYEEKKMEVTGGGVSVRDMPSITGNKLDYYNDGRVVTVVDEVTSENSGCDGNWLKIIYNDTHAYSCSTFFKDVVIEEEPDTNYQFQEELAKFPADYQEKLLKLHEIYPNAVFIRVDTTNNKADENGSYLMDFSTAVYYESYSYNKSLIWDSNNSRDGLKNLDTYNPTTNTFDNSFSGGGTNWYSASPEIVAYYLDSRNFLDEVNVFMFESLMYNEHVHTITGVEKILAGSYMAIDKVDGGTKSFAEVIMEAAAESTVSPYHLASRIRQEVGSTRSGLVQGTYPSYPQFNGFYNYYNIGASGSQDLIIYNGLSRAVQEGWNSESAAIIGGANWILDGYIEYGLDTNYFQKWDVLCQGYTNCFNYQYMQNIEAPYHEGQATYNAYLKSLESEFYKTPFVFKIPVYQNMPESSPKPSEESPINYLNSLVVNGSLIANFSYNTTSYNLEIPHNVTNLNIEATPIDDGATITGLGDIEIKEEEQKIVITVTAANGSTKNYEINVKKLQPDENLMTLEETLNNLTSLRILDVYLSGLTNVDNIKNAVIASNPNATVVVKDQGGNILTTGNMATSYTVEITANNETKLFSYVLYGDVNGDSLTDIVDLLMVQKEILKAHKLNMAQSLSADVNKDGIIDILDLLMVQKHILNVSYIIQ